MTNMTLAAIAGMDMTEIEEVRFESLPHSQLHFKVENTEMVEGETKDGNDYARILVKCKVMECYKVLDRKWENDPESLEGKSYTEGFFLDLEDPEKLAKGLGRFKAFFIDCGAEAEDGKTDVQSLAEALIDHEFVAIVTARKDKDNPDNVYNNFGKVGPLGE